MMQAMLNLKKTVKSTGFQLLNLTDTLIAKSLIKIDCSFSTKWSIIRPDCLKRETEEIRNCF